MINYSRAFLTLTFSLVFSLVGTWTTEQTSYLFAIPVFFGISIPLANWTDLGELKIIKVIVSGVVSSGLFYLALTTMFNVSVMYFSAGLSGLILLWFYSIIIKNLRPAILSYPLTLILCILALMFAFEIVESYKLTDYRPYIFTIWTFLFTIGLSTGFEKKAVANKK